MAVQWCLGWGVKQMTTDFTCVFFFFCFVFGERYDDHLRVCVNVCVRERENVLMMVQLARAATFPTTR